MSVEKLRDREVADGLNRVPLVAKPSVQGELSLLDRALGDARP
jgi:hypothetical protein